MAENDVLDRERTTTTSVRADLTAAFRWAARLGFHEGICNHFSAMLPDKPGCYLINPFGMHFSEMRASDLLVVDAEGRVFEGNGEVEATAFHIHSEIHRARPDALCVLHTHMPYATAIASLNHGRLAMCHQNAARFYGRIAYDDDTTEAFQGLALSGSEGARMVRALGEKSALLLKSHGPLVVGTSVAEAFDDLYYLERAAQNQVLAASMNQTLAEIDQDTARRTAADFKIYAPAAARAHLDAIQRILDKDDPAWRA
ncbi:hypothetical protein WL94_13325 [Burkholderia cepacia]|uniref:aldolase n=1 Tax=Burkholderia cepacia TaxID=292 RepID=UPI00075971E3|nr:aldolase [Burkholderia cepacia]KWF91851.1 hypothetical protein WL94_13325 [Burkholderia cepacia]